jgi:hypothetical protein
MGFRWDDAKARKNRRKHRVDFADAVGVFEDPRALTREDSTQGEERSVTVGLDLLGRILVVVWTWREGDMERTKPVHTGVLRE